MKIFKKNVESISTKISWHKTSASCPQGLLWTGLSYIRGNQISLSWAILSKSIGTVITLQGVDFYFGKIVSMSWWCIPCPKLISPTFKSVIFASLQFSNTSSILCALKEEKSHLKLIASYVKYYFKLLLMHLVLKSDRISDWSWKGSQNFMCEDTGVD